MKGVTMNNVIIVDLEAIEAEANSFESGSSTH
jgi:hypothetical protein